MAYSVIFPKTYFEKLREELHESCPSVFGPFATKEEAGAYLNNEIKDAILEELNTRQDGVTEKLTTESEGIEWFNYDEKESPNHAACWVESQVILVGYIVECKTRI